jgi:anoctamin-10
VIWSVVFVEWWRIRELILSVRWGSLGAVQVEKRRPQFRGDKRTSNDPEDAFPWWKRELRVLASVPVILAYAFVLVLVLTVLFVFEVFVAQSYSGPGARVVSFSPTILFTAFIPQLLGLYNKSAIKLTNWENHFRQSSYDYSLTIKTFALSGLVAYSSLALTAFLYIPYHEQVMTLIHTTIFSFKLFPRASEFVEASITTGRFEIDPNRLQDQMFAFTVSGGV